MDQQIITKDSEVTQKRFTKVFRIVLFILVVVSIIWLVYYSYINANLRNIEMINFPTNSNGVVCNIDYKLRFPFLYIDMGGSVPIYRCVDHCPVGNQFVSSDSSGEIISTFETQTVNSRFGGICWSQQKQIMLKERGYYDELILKESILINLNNVLLIMVIGISLSLAMLILYYFLAAKVNFCISILSAALFLLGVIVAIIIERPQKLVLWASITTLVLFVFITIVTLSKKQLLESIQHSDSFVKKIKQTGSCGRSLKFIITLFVFNCANSLVLLLVLFEYICLSSSQPLYRKEDYLFYTTQRTVWKYICLIFQWLFLSNFIEQAYYSLIVRFRYQAISNEQTSTSPFSLNSLLNITQISLILTVVWLPLKIVDLLKPPGAVVMEHEQETIGQTITRAAYCCCGGVINFLHKFTFNPYLVLVLSSSYTDNLSHSLSLVQQIYHKKDCQYDRSSLWAYKLSNYVIISVLSILLLIVFEKGSLIYLDNGQTIFFFVISVVLSVNVSQLNLNFWSIMTQVQQFRSINQQNSHKLVNYTPDTIN